MAIRFYKAYTPSNRTRSCCDFSPLTKKKSCKNLTFFKQRQMGKNNQGITTLQHRGGGHKRLYRQIDFKRNVYSIPGIVKSIEYDPNRSTFIALVHYKNGQKRYILEPKNLNLGDTILADYYAPISPGNTLPLKNIPLGTDIHNIELTPGKGGQLVKSAGSCAQLLAKEGRSVTIRLPSGEIRSILNTCWASIGQLGNSDWNQICSGKAGRSRWLNRRPHVRGSVKNPVDHPHGGGEGRAPIGRKQPVTPWGKPTLGQKTRNKKKYSNCLIIRKRK